MIGNSVLLRNIACLSLLLFLNATIGAEAQSVIGGSFYSQVFSDRKIIDPEIGDWDEPNAQAVCAKGYALKGISVARNKNHGHAIFCSIMDSTVSGHLGRIASTPVFFNGVDNRRASRKGDWDDKHYKLECDVGEYIVGVSQGQEAAGRQFHGIQCAKGIYSEDVSTTRVYTFPENDDRGSGEGGDWDRSYHKGQCADNEFMVGVSFSQGSYSPHAILCSTASRVPSSLNIVYAPSGTTKKFNFTSSEHVNNFSLSQTIVADYSLTPALASFKGKIYLAYKGSSGLCVVSTSSFGKQYSTPICLSVSILDSPTLAVFNKRLYIAYRGPAARKARDSADMLCVARMTENVDAMERLSCQTEVRIANSPTMAAFNNKLYVAFKGVTNDNLYVASSTDGLTFARAPAFAENQIQHSPSMTVFNGQIYVAYKDKASGKLKVSSSSDGRSFSGPKSFGDINMTNSPALAASDGKIFVAYKNNTNDMLCLASSSRDVTQFTTPNCLDSHRLEGNPALATQNFADALPNVKFAVFGDMPYGASANLPFVPLSPEMDDGLLLSDFILPRLSSSVNLPFLIHLGDIGRPGGNKADKKYDSCDDNFRKQTLASWSSLGKFMFFTPGDNDWTDCNKDRVPDSSLDPLDALKRVRSVFFSENRTNQEQNWNRFEIQDGYPENEIWMNDKILYAIVHIVGSNNGHVSPEKEKAAERIKEANDRTNASISWINRVEQINNSQLTFDAVVIAFHVDLFGADWNCLNNTGTKYDGICNKLEHLARKSDKPVLFVHGDTNAHCLRKYTRNNTTFWVLNAPGDFKSLDADLVSIDKNNLETPFSAVGILSGKSPTSVCEYRE